MLLRVVPFNKWIASTVSLAVGSWPILGSLRVDADDSEDNDTTAGIVWTRRPGLLRNQFGVQKVVARPMV